MHEIERFQVWLADLRSVRWRDAALTLRERFRQDRLGLTAGSLTFTTTIALVPFLTVALAMFTVFPMFSHFQDVLQKWLLASLVPDAIARQVLGYLGQFAGKASKLGTLGLVALLASALALIFTIDRTLNTIWRVRAERTLGQRLLVYWAAITVGPVVLGASLSLTSYALSLSGGVVGGHPGGLRLWIDTVQFLLGAGAMAALYHYVPNTYVRWKHAWMGGFFVALGMELARRALELYLSRVPTYSLVYGAFATVPILLSWIYMVWALVLLGATLTAYLPTLADGIPRRRAGPGWRFMLGLEVLRQLDAVQRNSVKGYSLVQLCVVLAAASEQLEPVLEALVRMDWIGQLHESGDPAVGARYVLLVNPDTTPMQGLLQQLLLPRQAQTESLWRYGRWTEGNLRDML